MSSHCSGCMREVADRLKRSRGGEFRFDRTAIPIHFLPHGFYLIPLAAHRAAHLLEHFHDVRVVWPFEIQELAALAGHPGELGHRLLRIPLHDPGEPLGQLSLFRRAAQDHAGGHHALGVLRFRDGVPGRKDPVELHRGVRVHPRGGGVHVLAAQALTARNTKRFLNKESRNQGKFQFQFSCFPH